ncbi:Sec-independent protein translocase protein TatB [Desulfocurvus vexinensis]|uniref:Sec-independent protein translocase protein TatB n=1 Tax=Desulfocurvus vexinensis TaxID=399548 RepID=UPI00048AC44A|nr:Sec-independent protein translocase protein TatB [Desulfocurvus vexinensis]
MFGSIGSMEILLIVVVALLVVGPKKLPQVARTLGKTFGEFKRVTSDVQRTISTEVDRAERQERVAKAKSELLLDDAAPKVAPAKAEATADTPKEPAKGA